ncbi:hypothetical protein DPMN_052920 [Dreissena polymorpha]|uniref:Uncharacterized protein n=1 Tax=Dreissena polymorpha TaxID=45954 RepID=A0A9D4CMR6_DREPO|nr:hypothetical protein DPMN_052920 [Dreissena polymorpha]
MWQAPNPMKIEDCEAGWKMADAEATIELKTPDTPTIPRTGSPTPGIEAYYPTKPAMLPSEPVLPSASSTPRQNKGTPIPATPWQEEEKRSNERRMRISMYCLLSDMAGKSRYDFGHVVLESIMNVYERQLRQATICHRRTLCASSPFTLCTCDRVCIRGGWIRLRREELILTRQVRKSSAMM